MQPPGTRALLITAKVNVISHDGSALRIGCDDVSILKSASQLKVAPVTSAVRRKLLSKVQITEGTG